MKNILSKTTTAIILLIVTVLLTGNYVYLLTCPIAYGMKYRTETVYEGQVFEGTLKYFPDGTMTIKNTSFDREMPFYYYYKDGYVFTLVATSDEEYEAICRYDDMPIARLSKTVGDKFLGKSPKKLRRAAVSSWLLGSLAAILAGVLLYFADSQYLLVSILIALFGSLFSWFAAAHFFTVANIAEKVDYLLAEQGKKK